MSVDTQDLPEDLKEFFRKHANVGMPDADSEGDIVRNYQTNTLYKHDFKQGSYFSLVSDDSFTMQFSEKVKFTVAFIKNKEDLTSLTIEKFKYEKGQWIEKEKEKISISNFNFEKLVGFLYFLANNNLADFSERKVALTDEMWNGIDDETKKKIFNSLKDGDKVALIKTLLNDENINSSDLVNLGYRKKQLSVFEKLLNDQAYFDKCKEKLKKQRNEDVWQYFFEKNSWIFGYGLSYVFCTGYDEKKLEQVVSGHNFNSDGKRVDGLLKTISDIQQFALVEIKLPSDQLIEDEVRPSCWAISKKVTDGVSQIQKTVHKFKKEYFDKAEEKDSKGYSLGTSVYNFVPQSYLIIGRLNSFMQEDQIHEEQYSSFQLYRDSLSKPQIITYDELYNRARFIIEKTNQ